MANGPSKKCSKEPSELVSSDHIIASLGSLGSLGEAELPALVEIAQNLPISKRMLQGRQGDPCEPRCEHGTTETPLTVVFQECLPRNMRRKVLRKNRKEGERDKDSQD